MNSLLLLLLCLLGLALAAPLPDVAAAQRGISTLTTGSPSSSPRAAPTGAASTTTGRTITVSGTWTVFPPPPAPASAATGKSAELLHIGAPHAVPFDTEGHITGSADSGHVGAPAFPVPASSSSSPPAASPDANYCIGVPHPHTVLPRSDPSAEESCVGAPRCRLSSFSSSPAATSVVHTLLRARDDEGDGGVEAEGACVGSPRCIHGHLPEPEAEAEGACVGCPEGGHAGGV